MTKAAEPYDNPMTEPKNDLAVADASPADDPATATPEPAATPVATDESPSATTPHGWSLLTLTNIRQLLLTHYSASLETSFKQFRLGVSVFFIGMVAVYGAHQLLGPSLQQELVTLIGLLLIGSGFLIAMLAQVRMVISRLLAFFRGP